MNWFTVRCVLQICLLGVIENGAAAIIPRDHLVFNSLYFSWNSTSLILSEIFELKQVFKLRLVRFRFFLKFQLIFEIKILFISLLDLLIITTLIVFNIFYISNEAASNNSHIWIFILELKIFSLSFTFYMIPFLLISHLMQLFSGIDFLLHLFVFQIIISLLNISMRYDAFLNRVLKLMALILNWQFIELSLKIIPNEIIGQIQKWKGN